MGFDITIKHPKKGLVIPKDSGYVPPNPDMPAYLRFSGATMGILNSFMSAVGAIDKAAATPDLADKCAKGKVPAYKFNFNDGERIEPEEAAAIAAALEKKDILAPAFIEKVEKQRRQPFPPEAREILPELMTVWIAFNKVAAANRGYVIK